MSAYSFIFKKKKSNWINTSAIIVTLVECLLKFVTSSCYALVSDFANLCRNILTLFCFLIPKNIILLCFMNLKVSTTEWPWIGSVYALHRSKCRCRQAHTLANSSGIHLTLPILAVLVWCHVVDAVGWRAVAGWAVRLWAGQRRHAGQSGQRLQSLWWVAAGSHARTGLQRTSERGEREVSLRLVRHASWVQQSHHLKEGGRESRRQEENK